MSDPVAAPPSDGHEGGAQRPTPKETEPPDREEASKPAAEDEHAKAERASADEAEQSEPDAPAESEQFVRSAYHLYGNIYTGTAVLGDALNPRAERVTGGIPSVNVDRALSRWVTTASYERALGVLTRRRLVVLTGAEGIGKRTGALALLREVAPADVPLASLSPTVRWDDLVGGRAITRPRGYLILDRLSGRADASVQRFDIERVTAHLAATGAYLVITSKSLPIYRNELVDYAVAWEPPNPVALLNHCLEAHPDTAIDPALLAEARERAGQISSPGAVVALVERLVDGDPDALGALDDSERRRVLAWFDQDRAPAEIRTLAVVAFVHDAPKHVFDAALDWLTRRIEERRPLRDSVDRLTPTTVWTGGHELIEVVDGHVAEAGPGSDRRLVFRSPQCREVVLQELFRRYGPELWEPLREWVRELASQPVSELHLQLAAAITMLARIAYRDAVSSYLDVWAAGAASERTTAALTLHLMAGDDRLAPAALALAKDWSDQRGQARGVTAAMAFSAELGIRYQPEALQTLWHLALRAERIADFARQSIAAQLIATADRDGAALNLLRFVHRRLRRVLAARPEPRKAAAALTVAVTVLGARRLDDGKPVAALLLRAAPRTVDMFAGLWSETLLSSSHRGKAMDALRDTLRALQGHPDAEAIAAGLGAKVRAGMPKNAVRLLHRDLRHDWQRSAGFEDNRVLATVLLDALGGRQVPTEKARGERTR
jgi:hypothetical protein